MDKLCLLAVFMTLVCSSLATTTETMSSTGSTLASGGSGGSAGGAAGGSAGAVTTTTESYKNFFDDPHNQATYIVLPVMIFVYGGCAVIYCIAKCRRNCKKRARRKQQEQLMRETREQQQQNSFDNMSYRDEYNSSIEDLKRNNFEEGAIGGTPTSPYDPPVGAAKPMLQRGAQRMGYNIMTMPNSTEDPVMNANIDVHLKNAFSMIENAARDIKMQQALGLKSCPDRYPADHENQGQIPKKGGYKQKYFIGV